jgi:pimeloyl-ACP methyl ester carboxylesterase
MGGRVAFEVYRLAPQRVTRLAVMNTGVGPVVGTEEERGRRHLLSIAFAQGIRPMAMEWLKGMIPPSRYYDTDLVEPIIRMFERKTPELFLIQQEALLARRDARPVLATVKCPTLVLTGRDDIWSPPVRHEEIAAGIRGSRLVLVPECGHMSTMEQPGAVSVALRDWLLDG